MPFLGIVSANPLAWAQGVENKIRPQQVCSQRYGSIAWCFCILDVGKIEFFNALSV